MDDAETMFETNLEELEDNFHNLPEVEAPPIAPEREPEMIEADAKGPADPEKESLALEGTDPSKVVLAEAIGGKSEHWEEVGSGDGRWVFDGEKIFNPATGEEYAGIDSEKSAVVQEEAVRQWNEGGSPHIVIPGHREETSDGVIVHAFQLILCERREDGFTDVRWTWHQTELSNLKEENERIEEDIERIEQRFSYKQEDGEQEKVENENVESAHMMLEYAHEALNERPDTIDAIATELIVLDVQASTAQASVEARSDSVPEVETTHELSYAAFLKDEAIEPGAATHGTEQHHEVTMSVVVTEPSAQSEQPPLEAVVSGDTSVESATADAVENFSADTVAEDSREVTEAIVETIAASEDHESIEGLALETITGSSADSGLEFLPVFVPNETPATPDSAVQTMYDTFILSFSKEAAATSPRAIAETTPDAKFDRETSSAQPARKQEREVAPHTQPSAIDTNVRGANAEVGAVSRTDVRPTTEKTVDYSLGALPRSIEIRIPKTILETTMMKVESKESLSPNVSRPESAAREYERLSETRISSRNAEIASRVLGIRFGADTGEPIIVQGSAPRMKPEDSLEDGGPRGRAIPLSELNGIRMIPLRNLRV